MDDAAFGWVQIVVAALGLTGAGGGLLGAWTHWHSTRAGVSANEKKAKQDRMTQLEEENRALRQANGAASDYAHDLRQQVAELGGKPKPWPDGVVRY